MFRSSFDEAYMKPWLFSILILLTPVAAAVEAPPPQSDIEVLKATEGERFGRSAWRALTNGRAHGSVVSAAAPMQAEWHTKFKCVYESLPDDVRRFWADGMRERERESEWGGGRLGDYGPLQYWAGRRQEWEQMRAIARPVVQACTFKAQPLPVRLWSPQFLTG